VTLRLRARREGLWWIRDGGARLHPWSVLAVFALLPLLTLAGVTLAVARQSWSYARLLDQPHHPAAQAEAAEVWEELNRVALLNLLHLEPQRSHSELPTARLEVGRRALDLMQEAIHRGSPALGHGPGGHKPYVPGRYADERGGPAECKVAYRGLTPPHHYAVKPSLRVRLKKAQVFGGQRYVELQRPEDAAAIINWLPEQVGAEVGLLTSQSDHVRLEVNRRFMGVYVRSYRPGEPLAIAQGRLPGVFYKGDAFDPQAGISYPLFTGEHWRLEPHADDGPLRAPLDALLDAVDRGEPAPFDWAKREALEAALDTDAYARFVALLILVGSDHVDAVHNHVLFWNTYRGRLEPVVWDLNGYLGDPQTPVDLTQHPIVDRLSRDPLWVHRRNLALWELLEGPGSAAAQSARLDAALARLGPDLRADPNLAALHPSGTGFARLRAVPVSELGAEVEAKRAWMRAREAFLRAYLSLAQVHVAPHPTRPGASRVQVAGAAAVAVTWEGAPAPRLLHTAYSESVYQQEDGKAPFLLPVARTYTVEAPPAGLRFKNAVTGGMIRLLPRPMTEAPTRSLRPEDAPAPSPAHHVLGPGEVRLDESLFVGPASSLTLRPGTTLRLAPGVGIYARGPVRAEGTPASPISILPADEEPFACIGLRGAATSGSVFRHVTVRGGSVGRDRSSPFLGMLSVYGCPDLVLEDCTFAANQVGDDLVNLANAQVRIEGCTFQDGRADGLDLDACAGVIRDSRFIDCGNDGLDLSHARVLVEDSVARGCGDKGLSVGEASQVVARRLKVESCNLGVQVKDASALLLEDSALLANGTGLHAYQKKWAFDVGGVVALHRTRILASQLAGVSLERRTAALAVASEVGPPGAGAERLQRAPSLSEAWTRLAAAVEGP
jgi:hypothetical protein